jgi:hypothetical protein
MAIEAFLYLSKRIKPIPKPPTLQKILKRPLAVAHEKLPEKRQIMSKNVEKLSEKNSTEFQHQFTPTMSNNPTIGNSAHNQEKLLKELLGHDETGEETVLHNSDQDNFFINSDDLQNSTDGKHFLTNFY